MQCRAPVTGQVAHVQGLRVTTEIASLRQPEPVDRYGVRRHPSARVVTSQ